MSQRTTFDLDDSTRLMMIKPVFECSLSHGSHVIQGAPGEHVFEILGRWLAITHPHIASERVQQTGALTWACRSASGENIEFKVVL